MYCPTCGQLNDDSNSACAHCGESLPEHAVAPPPPPSLSDPVAAYSSPLPEVPSVSYAVPEPSPTAPYPWDHGASGGPQTPAAPVQDPSVSQVSFEQPVPSSPAGPGPWGAPADRTGHVGPPPPPPAPGPQDYRSSYERPASPYVTQGRQQPVPPMPPTYLWQSVVVLLLCCLPLGVVALVFATQVSSRHESGDYAGAVDASGRARTWATVAFIAGLLFYVLYSFLIVIGVGAY